MVVRGLNVIVRVKVRKIRTFFWEKRRFYGDIRGSIFKCLVRGCYGERGEIYFNIFGLDKEGFFILGWFIEKELVFLDSYGL